MPAVSMLSSRPFGSSDFLTPSKEHKLGNTPSVVRQDTVTASDGVMAMVSDRAGCVAVRDRPSDLITLPLLWILLFSLVDAQGQGELVFNLSEFSRSPACAPSRLISQPVSELQ
ncbi:hypothetical protein KOW79_014451 [Hemibagrus wyckioides]|uniref:Uncharacterized protein n=1 Tax=Hemibagrus wyckioides TaxID=337641 RepID=A0A9D3NET9_9TELE|nr:hypothetical protein KOW79_014451 [Hemibagrus wyckioides]